jgi:hypothetical protein
MATEHEVTQAKIDNLARRVRMLETSVNKKKSFLSDVPWTAVDKPAPKVSIDWPAVWEAHEAWRIQRANRTGHLDSLFDPERMNHIEQLVEAQLKGDWK